MEKPISILEFKEILDELYKMLKMDDRVIVVSVKANHSTENYTFETKYIIDGDSKEEKQDFSFPKSCNRDNVAKTLYIIYKNAIEGRLGKDETKRLSIKGLAKIDKGYNNNGR